MHSFCSTKVFILYLLCNSKFCDKYTSLYFSQVESQHRQRTSAEGQSKPLAAESATLADDATIEEMETASYMAAINKPVQDQSRLWEAIGAAQFCSDGVADGWDSDPEESETAEEKYLKVISTIICLVGYLM